MASSQYSPPSLWTACEPCRRLKMRCNRPSVQHTPNGEPVPCERCRKSKRPCTVSERRQPGRKPGSLGRYQGVEKAARKMQLELQKVDSASAQEAVKSLLQDGARCTDVVPLPRGQSSPCNLSAPPAASLDLQHDLDRRARTEPELGGRGIQGIDRISNPLALLANVSCAAQERDQQSSSPTLGHDSAETGPGSLAKFLLRRPGYVSLGLNVSKGSLEEGLEDLLRGNDRAADSRQYFRRVDAPLPGDTGPEFDPVELGLLSTEEVYSLFSIYFARLHPINGILDPVLHTPEFVRSRSALLFTWILALTAQFDPDSTAVAKRLRLHGEKLSREVCAKAYRSVEIVQGYYISLLSATPAPAPAEDHTWAHTNYAFGLAVHLGLDQRSHCRYPSSPDNNAVASTVVGLAPPGTAAAALENTSGPQNSNEFQQRMARNRERTWLRTLIWERGVSAVSGRSSVFPETDLTLHIDEWWRHPLADHTDRYTCAFVLLRKNLFFLQTELCNTAIVPRNDPHWVRKRVDSFLSGWCQTWLLRPGLPMMKSYDAVSNAFLRHVYLHGRLWTLSFALQRSSFITDNDSDGQAVSKPLTQDCFEAAVRCCEAVVRDMQSIGEPLYCMPAPVWSMMSYAAIVALHLFHCLYGTTTGQDVELLALVAQVARQLEKAGTTPSHRLGIAALLGQHLFVMLGLRAADLKGSAPTPEDFDPLDENAVVDSNCQTSFGPAELAYDVGDDSPWILQQPTTMDLSSQPSITPFLFPNEVFTNAGYANLMEAGLYSGFDPA